MTTLVFGKIGQVAMCLQDQAEVLTLDQHEADFTDPDHCAQLVAETDADIIINAVAYTAVDKAETDTDIAELVNHTAPAAMAQAAAKRGIPFLHVSTDYVFPGDGTTPWSPQDAPGPLGVYGATKLRGDQAVTAAGGPHAILRTSWVFSAHGNNFVKTMIRLGREREALTIVGDQIGGPTAAADIARALLTIADGFRAGTAQSGTYHFSGTPDCSWADFATEIFAQTGIDCTVTPIPTSDYPTPATRPLNSRLNCAATETAFGIPRPDWRDSLRDVLKDLGELA